MEDKKIKAMIVEDDPDFCFLIKQTLYTAGIDIVGTASDAAGAVRAAVEQQPDVVLMDLGLSDSG